MKPIACCLTLAVILTALSGCGHLSTDHFLLLNTNQKNGLVFDKASAQTINRFVLDVKPYDIYIGAIAKAPLGEWQSTRHLEATRVRQILTLLRSIQRANENPSPEELRVLRDLPKEVRFWGGYTDHAASFRLLSRERKLGSRAVILIITDGENEGHAWSEVDSALRLLYSKGPTRLIVLGLSQRIIDTASQTSVADVWRESLSRLGAKDLRQSPKADKGYYLSSVLSVSGNILK